MPGPTELPSSVFPELLPPQACAWLGVVDVEGTVRQWSFGSAKGWHEAFPLGSVTKLVVALVVQALEQQGQIALDHPLMSGLPITLRHLLCHTAGLPDVLPSVSFDLAQVRSWSLLPPGTAFSYSNLGFIVAGAWLALQTGCPLSVLAAQHVFAPYAMTQATLRDDLLGAAGGLVATGKDVSQLLIGLLRAPSRIRSLVIRQVKVPSRPGMSAGLGCFQRFCGGTWLIEHEGFTGDASCVVCLAPEAGWGYVLLTKHWPVRLARIRNRLEAAWFGSCPTAETTLQRLPPKAHAQYVGEYVNGPRRLRIVSQGEELYLERAGRRFPLVQADGKHLAVAVPLRERPSTLAVITGSDGGVIGLYPFGSLRAMCRLFG
jgi:hypothetical protein